MTNPAADNPTPSDEVALGKKAMFLFFATFGTTFLLFSYTANVAILLHVDGTVERVRNDRLSSTTENSVDELGTLSWYLFFTRIPLWLALLLTFPPLYYGLLALVYDLGEQRDFELRTKGQICWNCLFLVNLFILLVTVIGVGFNACNDVTEDNILPFIGYSCLFSLSFIPTSTSFSSQILGWNPDAEDDDAAAQAPPQDETEAIEVDHDDTETAPA